jgi:filamentous hemagglutinin
MPQILYPRGVGASEGSVPAGYVEVHRWTGLREVDLWMKNGGTYIPGGIGAGGRVYVTAPGAPQPPGTGPCRIEFFFPERGLQVAGHPLWYQILQPVQNTPLYNVRIHVP